MPIRVYYDEPGSSAGWCTIRPTPFISISTSILKTGGGETFGVTYQITLTGKILAGEGSPYAGYYLDHVKYDIAPSSINPPSYPPTPSYVGPYGAFDDSISHFHDAIPDRPWPQIASTEERVGAILFKQKAIRELFSKDFRKIEITDWNDDSNSAIYVYPRVVSVDFSEGIYINTCDYTITLEADTLLDANNDIDMEASAITLDDIRRHTSELQLYENFSGAFIQSFNEDWSIEVDETFGETQLGDDKIYLPQSYRITRSLSCTGKRHFMPDKGTVEAWEMARRFVTERLKNERNEYATDPNAYYPNRGYDSALTSVRNLASGSMNLIKEYEAYNHSVAEQISESEGTFSVSESWLLATGDSYENFQLSISNSIDAPFIDVSINGTIKGLTTKNQSDYDKEKNNLTGETPKEETQIEGSGRLRTALNKYYEISNTGNFGIGCDIFKRANNTVAVQLNSQPKSISLGTNPFTGELTYSLSFDNRPLNAISGVLSEQISVNDTYPGDVIAVIPVLGRSTGPVLQYMGGRTEYRRDVSINLLMDYSKIAYDKYRDPLILKKPSIVQPQASQLQNLLKELSPSNEPGVRKYFLASAPSESWNPKEGSYSINLSWVYELNK
jgi:hypothetical protein